MMREEGSPSAVHGVPLPAARYDVVRRARARNPGDCTGRTVRVAHRHRCDLVRAPAPARKGRRPPLQASLGMLLVFLVLAAATASRPALAQDIVLRSGEHERFTRLVLQLPEGTQWQVATREQGVELSLSGTDRGIDISQAFDRIPRTRLRDITLIPQGIRLALACACPLRAFEDVPGLLVLDIDDPPDADARPGQTADLRQPTLSDSAGRELARALRDGRQTRHPRDDLFPLLPPSSGALAGARDDAVADRLGPEDGLARLAAPLRHDFARAIAVGALQPAPEAALTPHAESRPAEPRLYGDIGDLPLAERLNLRNALDRPRSPPDPADPRHVHCPDPHDIDPQDWGHGASFLDGLSDLRAGLLHEFDTVDPVAAARLVRHYLHFGFGAEARLVLDSLTSDVTRADLLRALSHVLDGGTPPEPAILRVLLECEGPGALWAMLAVQLPPAELRAQALPVARSFAALPAHLRRHLGPEVARQLIEAGAHDAALMVRDAMGRASEGGMPGLQLTDARIAAITGTDQRNVPLPAPGSSIEAMSLALERALADGTLPRASLIEDALSMLPEHRTTPQGRTLLSLIVRNQIALGAFESGLDTLLLDERSAGEIRNTQLLDEFYMALAADAPEQEFVAVVFRDHPWRRDTLAPATAERLADRLAHLGFDRHAGIMGHAPADEGRREIQTALESLPASGAQDLVDALPADSPDSALAPLAVESSRQAGFGPAGTPDPGAVARPAIDAAMQRADRLPDSEPASLQPGADAVPAHPEAEVGTLAHGRALLDRSAALRNEIAALLDAGAPGEGDGDLPRQ